MGRDGTRKGPTCVGKLFGLDPERQLVLLRPMLIVLPMEPSGEPEVLSHRVGGSREGGVLKEAPWRAQTLPNESLCESYCAIVCGRK